MTRLLVYAQSPPPLHGQSVMVGHLLDGLQQSGQCHLPAEPTPGTSPAIAYYHINPRISKDLGDIGRWRPGKLLAVFRHVLAALRARFVHGLDTLYFVPAPAKREAMYRDWFVLFFCRPFFRNVIFHWHCIGQPAFIENKLTAPERWIARLLYGKATLSICMTQYSREEASYFGSKKIAVVPNGIPDPCPRFDTEVWPERQRRAEELAAVWSGPAASPVYYELLFLSGRMTSKGLFDAMAAATLANHCLAEKNLPLRMRLTVAGAFEDDAERVRFEKAAEELNSTRLPGQNASLAVDAGWADEKKKIELYQRADCFIFPTLLAESFGLVLVEAMAHGCAIVTTRWQAVPEVLPPGFPNLAEIHDIEAMAAALLRCAQQPADRSLRDYFLEHFTSARFTANMIRTLSQP